MFDAAIARLEPIEPMPAMGPPHLGQPCEIPGLRSWRVSWRVTAFPMQWLYVEAHDHLDVVRLPGDRQDIVAMPDVDERPGQHLAHRGPKPSSITAWPGYGSTSPI